MAISPLSPKPPQWPIQPGAVDPGQRWVWHTRPRFILPLWEHASAGAAQRYVRLAQTRRTARIWQLNTGDAHPLRAKAVLRGDDQRLSTPSGCNAAISVMRTAEHRPAADQFCEVT
jgi:hypothetical protein